MSNKYTLSVKYADMLREAASFSCVLQESVGTDRSSQFVKTLADVGRRIRGLVDDYGYPASDDEKTEVIELIASELGYRKPRRLGRLLREGSVTSLMAMSTALEDLFAALQPDDED